MCGSRDHSVRGLRFFVIADQGVGAVMAAIDLLFPKPTDGSRRTPGPYQCSDQTWNGWWLGVGAAPVRRCHDGCDDEEELPIAKGRRAAHANRLSIRLRRSKKWGEDVASGSPQTAGTMRQTGHHR